MNLNSFQSQPQNGFDFDSKEQVRKINSLAFSLQPYYSRFKVSNRLLFSAHSHQAWPDVAFQGIRQYQEHVCQAVDKKWGLIFSKLNILRSYLKNYYVDENGLYCHGTNTHQLIVSWLSSLNSNNRPKIITTDGEFHTIYRQLELYKINNVFEVIKVPVEPINSLTNRLLQSVDEKTSAIISSRVFFESGKINRNIKQLAEGCRKHGVYLLIDDYHGTNCVPLSFKDQKLDDIFLVTGGYKYLQWGQGNCFLRYPTSYKRYPSISGWFSNFADLQKQRLPGKISFDTQGENKFSFATIQPISIFRAAKVAEIFKKLNLTPLVLREQYQLQTKYLRNKFKQLSIKNQVLKLKDDQEAQNFGGFVSFYSEKCEQISVKLYQKSVFHDYRGKILRLGVAPYITTSQIDECIRVVYECIQQLISNMNM